MISNGPNKMRMDMMTNELQAERTAKAILDDNLCDEKLFQDMVVNYRLMKYVKGGRMTMAKDDTGTKVESSVWTKGLERIMIEALEKEQEQ